MKVFHQGVSKMNEAFEHDHNLEQHSLTALKHKKNF